MSSASSRSPGARGRAGATDPGSQLDVSRGHPMYHAIFVSPWPWWVAGSALGLVVVLTAWLGGKGLGVSPPYRPASPPASPLPLFQHQPFHHTPRLRRV